MNAKTDHMKPLLIILIFFGCMINAQDKKTEKAKENFNSYAYAEAIESYERLIDEGYSSKEIYKNLGDAYYQKADYNASSYWFGKLFEIKDLEIDAEYYYKYAQTLKTSGNYEDSDAWMQKFANQKNVDIRALKYQQNKDYLQKIRDNSSRYDIKNIAINTPSADFAPSFFGEQLIFSTARDTGKILKSVHKWNNKPFTNLYTSTASENGEYVVAERLSKTLNKKTHESSTAFTKDGTTVYFTRNNSKNGNFSRDQNGLSRLKIYRATLKDNKWKNATELPFNNDEYSVAHPSLSEDEKKLYFASDMPGTYGQSDIFVVDINEDGSFGVPENLGNIINTESRETFPYITNNDVLYFASDGHPGLGGLDMFATKIDDQSELYVVNVGEPINSPQDDFSFIMNEKNKKGFFASSREGGIGSDDLYSFIENVPINLNCHLAINGIVKDIKSGELLVNSTVILLNNNNEVIDEITSDLDGSFTLKGFCGTKEYRLLASKEEYKNGGRKISIKNSEELDSIIISLEKVIQQPVVGTDLIKFLDLSPIYFDLDKSKIRPDAIITLNNVIEFIDKYPDIKIEVQSHTDASASAHYNKNLSERRAKATIAYLEKNGIQKGSVKGHGYGESNLLNNCTEKDKCDDEGHQLNRRSELIVIKSL
ncbi:hypothetical protein LCGC14_0197930 [marine sediment metagenome]|uniref:OmpA-like domain-containing protein n=1 Tax=marine sediment metagenome TaxID=412755 RepID=A0A0F9UJE4_9ZZZZ|nr:OmpA family protein [Maribacter sp.]